MICKKHFLCLAYIVACLLLSGCANQKRDMYSGSRPGPQAELMKVVEIVTPTRVIVSYNYMRYTVDLAYFYPSTVLCKEPGNSKYCNEISDAALDKYFWVEREYDRFGLQMNTLWPAELKNKAKNPLNIDLLIYGGYSRMVDHIELPNGKSELVARAADLGFNKYVQGQRLIKMKPWQVELISEKHEDQQ